MALEEMKAVLAHERGQRELNMKAKQISESSDDGSSDSEVPSKYKRVHILKDLVASFVVVDDIDKWFEAYELDLQKHRVSEEDREVSL